MNFVNCNDTMRRDVGVTSLSLSWRQWLRDGWRLGRLDVVRALHIVYVWRMRARTRRHLALLDAHLRSDVGLSQAQAWGESQKPFWVD